MEAIWAEDAQHIIGKDGTLPWHLPYDLQFFKTMTMGKTMIMGRKTFEGMDCRTLPGRKTIVLTTQKYYCAPHDVIICHTLHDLLTYIHSHDEKMIVIGGTNIFNQLLPYCQTLYVTKIDAKYHGDTLAPHIPSSFQCTKQYFVPPQVTKNIALCIETYQKN